MIVYYNIKFYFPPPQVDIHYRIAWRLNYSTSTFCDQNTIEGGALIGPHTAGYLMCHEGCGTTPTRIGNVQIRCTDFSVVEDWITGVQNYDFDFSRAGQFLIRLVSMHAISLAH